MAFGSAVHYVTFNVISAMLRYDVIPLQFSLHYKVIFITLQ